MAQEFVLPQRTLAIYGASQVPMFTPRSRGIGFSGRCLTRTVICRCSPMLYHVASFQPSKNLFVLHANLASFIKLSQATLATLFAPRIRLALILGKVSHVSEPENSS